MHTTRPDYGRPDPERAATLARTAAARLHAQRLREDVLHLAVDLDTPVAWLVKHAGLDARLVSSIIEHERQAHQDALRSVVRASGSPYVARGVEATGEPLGRADLLARTTTTAARRAA
jgi:hypothetical protein